MPNDTSFTPTPRTAPARKRIGELLVEAGLVNVEQVGMALAYQRVHGGRLGSALVALGMLAEEQLHGALGRQLGIATADLETLTPEENVLSLLPEDFVRGRKVVPLIPTDPDQTPQRHSSGHQWKWVTWRT